MEEKVIIGLLILNTILLLSVWRRCGRGAYAVTEGTLVIGNNPNRGPQVYSRSDLDELNIQRERQGLPPVKEDD